MRGGHDRRARIHPAEPVDDDPPRHAGCPVQRDLPVVVVFHAGARAPGARRPTRGARQYRAHRSLQRLPAAAHRRHVVGLVARDRHGRDRRRRDRGLARVGAAHRLQRAPGLPLRRHHPVLHRGGVLPGGRCDAGWFRHGGHVRCGCARMAGRGPRSADGRPRAGGYRRMGGLDDGRDPGDARADRDAHAHGSAGRVLRDERPAHVGGCASRRRHGRCGRVDARGVGGSPRRRGCGRSGRGGSAPSRGDDEGPSRWVPPGFSSRARGRPCAPSRRPTRPACAPRSCRGYRSSARPAWVSSSLAHSPT